MRKTERESTKITAEVTPSLDLIFDLLSNRRRRYALYYMHDQPDGVATLDELTTAVVDLQQADSSQEAAIADEADSGDDTDFETDCDQRQLRIRTELQHTHLPKLEDAGVLDHDRRSETVRYWTQPSLEEWLEHAKHKELS
ncbi:DUF7344 domain-containing protein [Natronorubrum tibetense]|uniref:DUF7344 domain-containing protein n=1 Tax=Natronorubrum tibetense GA33 TaxID=1114856 RepID=L9VRT4_9EURY|nr:hypothetical protein [Natronorubrum tibetense]ELY39910.1 hypothetical protein C496_14581 [Natronorubrum tibetense GA33]